MNEADGQPENIIPLPTLSGGKCTKTTLTQTN